MLCSLCDSLGALCGKKLAVMPKFHPRLRANLKLKMRKEIDFPL
jgi:hypothetical protein